MVNNSINFSLIRKVKLDPKINYSFHSKMEQDQKSFVAKRNKNKGRSTEEIRTEINAGYQGEGNIYSNNNNQKNPFRNKKPKVERVDVANIRQKVGRSVDFRNQRMKQNGHLRNSQVSPKKRNFKLEKKMNPKLVESKEFGNQPILKKRVQLQNRNSIEVSNNLKNRDDKNRSSIDPGLKSNISKKEVLTIDKKNPNIGNIQKDLKVKNSLQVGKRMLGNGLLQKFRGRRKRSGISGKSAQNHKSIFSQNPDEPRPKIEKNFKLLGQAVNKFY